jgi:CheY-like chemotaxis protein
MQKPLNAWDDRPYALVADDEALIIMEAAGILEDAGFRPLEAYNLEMALDMLTDYGEALSLIFTDVQMRGPRDGFQLARTAVQLYPKIKVLVASGHAKPEDGDLPDGAVFITKPFSAEVVTNRLRELLPDGEQPEPLKNGKVI